MNITKQTTISLALVGVLLVFAFAGGQAYQRFTTLEERSENHEKLILEIAELSKDNKRRLDLADEK